MAKQKHVGKETMIIIRCEKAQRNAWIKLAKSNGLQLSPWIRMLASREVERAAK